MMCFRRVLEKFRLFVGGPARWFALYLPGCYCQVCEQCTQKASWRFYARYLNSCTACLTCESSSRHLWNPGQYGNRHDPGSVNFEMTPWYKVRYALGNFVGYLGAKIHSRDPKDSTDRAQELVAGGNTQ